jgi:hypothetical protein
MIKIVAPHKERMTMKRLRIVTRSTIVFRFLAVLITFTGRALAVNAFPGTDDGATSLLKEFLKPGADYAALSKQLRPTAADYAAVFDADLGKKMESVYGLIYVNGNWRIFPKPWRAMQTP